MKDAVPEETAPRLIIDLFRRKLAGFRDEFHARDLDARVGGGTRTRSDYFNGHGDSDGYWLPGTVGGGFEFPIA